LGSAMPLYPPHLARYFGETGYCESPVHTMF
jgi:hypothetical protein